MLPWRNDPDHTRGDREADREQRRETIRALWLACHTQQEIADAVGVTKETISQEVEESQILEALPKSDKLAALHEDADHSHARAGAATHLFQMEHLRPPFPRARGGR